MELSLDMWHDFIVPVGSMFYIVSPSSLSVTDVDRVPAFISNAIPFFFLMIFSEAAVAYIRRRSLYNVEEAVCSISLGIVQQITDVLLRGLSLFPYIYIYKHWRMFNIDVESPWVFAALFLGVDLGYYWMHRTAHEYHFMWIGHSVHHSGEYYNLATALRQGTTQALYSRFFYMPLAFIGFPPAAFLGHSQLNTLYQFWIHTDQIGKLGFLEIVLNTPSHHRMHHRPPGNCNYAGVLIIWDRLFGTFREEKEVKDFYGLGNQLNSFNPLYANYAHAVRMLNIDDTGSSASPTTKYGSIGKVIRFLSVLFRRRVKHAIVFQPQNLLVTAPSQLPPHIGKAPPGRIKYCSTRKPSLLLRTYSLIHFVLTLLSALHILLTHKNMCFERLLLECVLPVISLVSIGFINEGNSKAPTLETVRVSLIALILLYLAALVESGAVSTKGVLPMHLDLSGSQCFICALVFSMTWLIVYLETYYAKTISKHTKML